MTRSSSPAHDRVREFPGMIGCFRAAPNSGPTSKSLPGPQFSFGLDLFTLIRVRDPRFFFQTSVSELVATCSDFLGLRRLSSSEAMQCTCSQSRVLVVATAGYQNVLGCSVNKTRSGARTLTRTRLLGQCKYK